MLTDEELAKNRVKPLKGILEHPLGGQFYDERLADWSRVTVPFLSAAN